MFDDSRAFVSRAFLRSALGMEYLAWSDEQDGELRARLLNWAGRKKLKETSAEGAFLQAFFVETWGYEDAGRVEGAAFSLYPKLRIDGSGAGGGVGEADAALGWFGMEPHPVPQVLCEFKDIKSALDAPQARKGNTRSPVKQCQDYIRGARKGLFGNEPVQPWWGLVTDMNEVRLYWWDRMPEQYLRFVIQKDETLFDRGSLTDDTADARFDRFLFQYLLHRDRLLSHAGKPQLLRLIERQWVQERNLEGRFYDDYSAVRTRLFNALTLHNQDYPGTKTQLLRLTQKLLDRFIFAFYCEDMGQRMAFPPQLIRDRLKSRSVEIDYEPDGEEFWTFFKRLFRLMDTGGEMGRLQVPHINGGLFEADPEIEALSLPNHVFADAGQGANDASLDRRRDTLLYLCARYNYAAHGDARESLSLYTLGRIFERSITELELKEGELENRDTAASLSERKKNGVYYTPEWAVNLLVKLTMDPWFDIARAEAGLPSPDDATPPTVPALRAYETRLRTIRIVDPACGSGAFLISAFRRLLDERLALARQIAELEAGPGIALAVLEGELIAEILSNSIYGVDLNPSSVEIAKLALWLHSARADRPLSSLNHTLRCGNSLVGPDFWTGGRTDDPVLRERVAAFDWAAAYPELGLGAGGGFDIVLGNPPYVKRQHLEAAVPEVAAYLMAERGDDTYRSARTANFDLYLPFFEKGLRILGPGGRMGYIAPSLWPINQYGEGLRGIVRAGRSLERWVDFKSHQVFEDVTTYTALQVFAKTPTEAVSIALAPEGEGQASDVDWTDSGLAVPWDGFDDRNEWLMATGKDRDLIQRLTGSCLRLDDARLTDGITVGLQTSADDLYHLQRIGEGRFWCRPNPKTRAGAAPHEVEIEEAIMRPLVSGAEAKRYEEPHTETWLLFPYARDDKGQMRLIDEATMRARFPKAWTHLTRWEKPLRARERNAFDDAGWWRFGRNQNIDKQDRTKLVVPRLVEHLKCALDADGTIYLDNVDVGGVMAAPGNDPAFLMAFLNGPTADHVFRVTAKPFRGDYRSANKQFIAPLPIPNAPEADRVRVAERARSLQTGWTRRRDLLVACEARLGVLARARKDERWLWPDLRAAKDIEPDAPRALRAAVDRRRWAREQLDEAIALRTEALQARLDTSRRLSARFADGELRLLADGAPILSNIFLGDDEGRLIEAYWRWLLLSGTTRDADTLAKALRRPPAEADIPAAVQFVARVAELQTQTETLETLEAEMNDDLFGLYDLTPEERACGERADAASLTSVWPRGGLESPLVWTDVASRPTALTLRCPGTAPGGTAAAGPNVRAQAVDRRPAHPARRRGHALAGIRDPQMGAFVPPAGGGPAARRSGSAVRRIPTPSGPTGLRRLKRDPRPAVDAVRLDALD